MGKVGLNILAAASFAAGVCSFAVAVHAPFFIGLVIIPLACWSVFFASIALLSLAAARLRGVSPKAALIGAFAITAAPGLALLATGGSLSPVKCDRAGTLWHLKQESVKAVEDNLAANNEKTLAKIGAMLPDAMPADTVYGSLNAEWKRDSLRFKMLSDKKYIVYSVGPDGLDGKLEKKIDLPFLLSFESRFTAVGGPGGRLQQAVRNMCLWEMTKPGRALAGDVVLAEGEVGKTDIAWPASAK